MSIVREMRFGEEKDGALRSNGFKAQTLQTVKETRAKRSALDAWKDKDALPAG